ncbi:MAG: SGNH/GDSL hydrolase family protein, partial [Phycisphaerae bacterium]
MMASRQTRGWIAVAMLLLLVSCATRPAERVSLAPPDSCYVFTDQVAVLSLPAGINDTAPIPYSLKTITRDGWGPAQQGALVSAQGQISLRPLAEGIHILTLTPAGAAKPTELRFVALAPPPKLDRQHLNLRHSAAKLWAGQPYTIVAMGDSVTATGDYAGILAKLLQRATGNAHIRVVVKGFPGRSVDATVRHFARDIVPEHPDLGLLMYGLNDQAAGAPLAAYLEQYEWVARQFQTLHADLLFLTPTPDISRRPEVATHGLEIFRTIGYAAALEPVAQRCQVPLVDNFHTLWGSGGATLDASGR